MCVKCHAKYVVCDSAGCRGWHREDGPLDTKEVIFAHIVEQDAGGIRRASSIDNRHLYRSNAIQSNPPLPLPPSPPSDPSQ